MRTKRGFTLIELLVVIAIIAILAAILFPVFTSAKERSRVSGCQSNMRQIYMALMHYTDDWGGRFPNSNAIHHSGYLPLRTSLDQLPHPGQIHSKLYKYVKNRAIFRCPSDRVVPPVPFDPSDTPTLEIAIYAFFGSSYQWRFYDPYKVPPMTNPLGAEGQAGQTVGFFSRPGKLGIARDATAFHISHLREMKATGQGRASENILFLDGHVKLVPVNEADQAYGY